MYRHPSWLTALLLIAPLTHAAVDVSETDIPLFVSASTPPLNMLVMGRDHKLYYEAYNDASDLNGDGVIDVGYKGYLSADQGGIDYYGYFNSHVCYTYGSDGIFAPSSYTADKTCSGKWSGDYLNYLTTSRMDALRKVLYGGYRVTDEASRNSSNTVLQGAFIPQDAHTWGKEYQSYSKDGYLISKYTELSQPATGYRHLFAVVSLSDGAVPQLRTLTNTTYRAWNWVSKERPVAGDDCDGGRCTARGPTNGWSIVPQDVLSKLKVTTWRDSYKSPTSTSEMNELFGSGYTSTSTRCGTGNANFTTIQTTSNFQNPYVTLLNGCSQDYYHTRITATLSPQETGTYEFSVDGDDAVDVKIDGTVVASYYGAHGATNAGGAGNTGSKYLESGKTYEIEFRHEEAGGNASFALYWKAPGGGTSTLVNKNIKVRVCTDDSTLRDSNCVAYANGRYKPTGILHDYGDANRMYFGLLTGSYENNMSGGVLRSQLQSFKSEYNTYGQFCYSNDSNCSDSNSVTNGIVATIDKLRIIDFNYSGKTYGCGWDYAARTMTPTSTPKCYMWGNPIGEMMYETMRYFAGAQNATSIFDYSSGKDSQSPLNLPKVDEWVQPYVNSERNPNGYPRCSVPVMTVISDINPSYDYKLPGSQWDTSLTSDSALPETLNVSTEADAIWEKEGGGTVRAFIGESNGKSDSAPTAKDVINLSSVRGLSPEEPSKQGTYYSAAIAHYGANNRIGGDKTMQTYSVALASPLPTIKFPVGGSTVTVVPFAKSVKGSGIENNENFQPTDQIVDYYVETIANTDVSCSTASPSSASDCDSSVNSGRPYAKFRINYEDIEQGADHDMDAIALYELMVNDQNKLVINVTSEYAAGGVDQHMGYVISGTTADGVYLEVKDQGGSDYKYKLDTPSGVLPNGCASSGSNCAFLGLSSSRTFTASSQSNEAVFLENPLWYAAKYGKTTPDVDETGTPNNYLLVTNALTLRDQLDKAFSDIVQQNYSVTRPTVQPTRQDSTSADGSPYVYRTTFDFRDWSGDLIKEITTRDEEGNETTTAIWRAATKLNANSSRKILMADASDNTDGLVDFTWANLQDKSYNGTAYQDALNKARTSDSVSDGYGRARVAFVRGDSCTGLDGCSGLRTRESKLGDIVNSSPVLVQGAQYLNYRADSLEGENSDYAAFKAEQAERQGVIYVGANDGMLHAFAAGNTSSTTDSTDNGGNELFAFIPSAVINNLNRLTGADYTGEDGLHQYYVDGNITVSDVFYDNTWHTVLVGTLGAGGREVFALDVTTPSAPKLLWEFTAEDDTDLGYTIPKAMISRLHTGEWAALVPNGYRNASNQPVLFALDIKTGELVAKIAAEAELENDEENDNVVGNGLSNIRPADVNGDAIDDYVYGGDLLGNLWRFDLLNTSSSTPFADNNVNADDVFKVSFGGSPLYVARAGTASSAKRQPITAAPRLVRHPTGIGYLVVFGTGQYLGSTDKSSTDLQSMYGIWDRYTSGTSGSRGSAISRSSLMEQTLSNSSTLAGARELSQNSIDWYSESATNTTDASVSKWGWYFDLAVGSGDARVASGERMVYEMSTYGDGLIFTTITPNEDPCAAGISGMLYGINPLIGGALNYNFVDINGDGVIDSSDGPATGIEIDTPGQFGISDGSVWTPDGEDRKLGSGPGGNGRQSWQTQPANSTYSTETEE